MIKHYTAKFLKLFAKNCNFWDQMQSSFLFLFFLFDVFGLNFLGGIFSFNFLSPPYASCQFSTALIQYVFPASGNNSAISRYVHLGANNHIWLSLWILIVHSLLFHHLAKTKTWKGLLWPWSLAGVKERWYLGAVILGSKRLFCTCIIFSYREFSKKDLQFEFTLGASAVSEMKWTAKIFFPLQCDLWKISSP